MAFETISSRNTSAGIHTLFLYVADIVPIFIPLVLFAIFMITMLATYFSQRRITGRGDFPASFVTGGFLTVIIALVLSMVENLVNTITLSTTIVVVVVGVIWLFISKRG